MPSFNLPFGLPRRYIVLGAAAFTFLFFAFESRSREFASDHLSSLNEKALEAGIHPVNWLPDSLIANGPFGIGSKPPEWDEHGRCLFLSPFDALSAEEKARAEQLELVEVSEGIVRSKQALFRAPTDRKPALEGGNVTEADAMRAEDKTIGTGESTLTNPILGLLRDGERKWKDMIARQSQTLDQAVEEYKARYGRNPPKGFDEWWTFAHGQGVLLPDEYDA